MFRPIVTRLLTLMMSLALAVPAAWAGSSFEHQSNALSARLVVAEDHVTPDATRLSAGLVLTMKDGWKTYWKSPGQVGLPPEIDWTGSQNLRDATMLWPAPTRFVAFDIENYGYANAVTHPLELSLSQQGTAVKLRAAVALLVCSDICVPENFELSLDLPARDAAPSIDAEAATLIADAAARVPVTGPEVGFEITAAALDAEALSLSLRSDIPMTEPSVFPDMGLDAAFGAPEVRMGAGGSTATVRMPVLSMPADPEPLEVTVVDGDRAALFTPALSATAPAQTAAPALWWTLGLAFLGGLILNVMPCVLPVLSIKFTSALKSSDQSQARIRAGFLVSALGVLAFMLSLALILLLVRETGGQVGWGMQFQSPVFIAVIVSIMTLFTANMAGLFEINLPQSWMSRLAEADGRPGLVGDFSTGALAAILATPCSAPFLGTAVTVALAGSGWTTMAIFTALGTGLALPYLLVAARPSLVQALPRPGSWMGILKLVLAAMMGATALWFAWVLWGMTGPLGVGVLSAALAIVILAIGLKRAPLLSGTALILAVAAMPWLMAPMQPARGQDRPWQSFSQLEVARLVSDGEVVFVDVTADWCLTCKANKSLVLDRAPVRDAVFGTDVKALQADWTRPDPTILSYLQQNGRYGIPFNKVYGPGAPDGIALPEILTANSVMEALSAAR